jgi:hypothetical protein
MARFGVLSALGEAGQPVEELVERRAGAEGNADQYTAPAPAQPGAGSDFSHPFIAG